jgi:transcriptional regulator with XRE-family HTH domain
MTFGEALKRFRERAGLTQAALAERAGLPLRSVQNWEISHREPRIDGLKRLARALGVTVDRLIADVEPDPAGEDEGRPERRKSGKTKK